MEPYKDEVVCPENCPISYATLFEENPMMLIIIDPEGTIISANKYVVEQLGYAREELLGTSVLNIFVEQDRATVEQQIKNFLSNSQQISRWELRKLRKDGSYIWVREFARCLSGRDGKRYILISCEDITELKKTAEERDNSIREWERTFDSVPDLVAILGKDCTIRRVNKPLADLLGLTPQECVGQLCYELIHGMDRPPDNCPHPKTLNDNQTHIMEAREERFGRDYIVSTTPITDPAGNNIGTLQVSRDITARKIDEERIANLNRELQQRLAELETIYNTAPIGIAICYDLQCANVKGNPVMAEILGLPPDGMWVTAQLEAQNKFKFMRDGSELPKEQLPMKIAIDKGMIVRNATLDILHADGRKIMIYGNAAPLLDHDGKVYGVVGAFMDISELKKAEESIEELNRQLKKKISELEYAFSELDAFSYSVSHDLNAPLRRIDNYYWMILDKSRDTLDKNTRSYLARMKENVDQMKELIEALLALSKVSRKKIEVSEIDLAEMARKIFSQVRTDFPDRNIFLEVKDLPPAVGDSILLNQVLTNLLSNACKFTEDKDPSRIEVGGWAEARENVYFVKDNGTGFDMKFANRIFNVFQRLHTTEEFEGTGIGLSIVQRAILRHDGRVWAEGTPGEGATFYFSLPRKNVI